MTDKSREYGSLNDGAAYCPTHGRYNGAGAGCPICVFEESISGAGAGGISRIQRCPVCGEMSLFWYRCSNHCECLNLECKLRQAEAPEY
ncbi:hypothetical protein ACFLXV_04250 [Chloroflexota bacterium]